MPKNAHIIAQFIQIGKKLVDDILNDGLRLDYSLKKQESIQQKNTSQIDDLTVKKMSLGRSINNYSDELQTVEDQVRDMESKLELYKGMNVLARLASHGQRRSLENNLGGIKRKQRIIEANLLSTTDELNDLNSRIEDFRAKGKELYISIKKVSDIGVNNFQHAKIIRANLMDLQLVHALGIHEIPGMDVQWDPQADINTQIQDFIEIAGRVREAVFTSLPSQIETHVRETYRLTGPLPSKEAVAKVVELPKVGKGDGSKTSTGFKKNDEANGDDIANDLVG